MANSLLKRILVFVAAYLIMSTILSFVFREETDLISIGETIEFQGKEVTIKVLYKEGEEIWAEDTLALASGSIEKLIEAYGSNSPHGNISIYSATSDMMDNYPFELDKDSSDISVPTDFEIDTVVWGISQMWIKRGFADIPEWVLWGQSAFMAYWAMEGSGFLEEAAALRTYLEEGVSQYPDELALGSYDLPGDLTDEETKTRYFLGRSFDVFSSLHAATSMSTMAEVLEGVMSSQNYNWDSSRYVSYVQDKTDVDVSEIFIPVFEGDVSSEIFKWKAIYYAELALMLILTALILMYVFWEDTKKRLSSLFFFRERSRAGRELLRIYGNKDRILMELEVYFKRHIPDDEYDKLRDIFFKEKILGNKS